MGTVPHPEEPRLPLAVEVGELLEHVQWGSDADFAERLGTADGREALAEGMADVLIYLVRPGRGHPSEKMQKHGLAHVDKIRPT